MTEVEFLKAYIHDLNCIVALPAAWSGGTASQILGTSLDVLRDVLRLDFIYARLRDPAGQAPIEMARVAQSDQQAADGQDVAPFVQVGGTVHADTTVGLVEAMKVFTSVMAGTSGVVVERLVDNAQFVEYGQALFLIRPEGA